MRQPLEGLGVLRETGTDFSDSLLRGRVSQLDHKQQRVVVLLLAVATMRERKLKKLGGIEGRTLQQGR